MCIYVKNISPHKKKSCDPRLSRWNTPHIIDSFYDLSQSDFWPFLSTHEIFYACTFIQTQDFFKIVVSFGKWGFFSFFSFFKFEF